MKLLLLLLGFSSLSGWSQVPTDNLRAYYPFSGNANDESTYDHNGIVNGASLSIDRFGNEESCYEFDGEDDFIQVLHTADLNFDAHTGTYSINFWFRSGNPVKTAFTAYAIQKDSSGSMGYPFHFDVMENDGLASPQFRIRGNTTTTTNALAPVWFDGDWHMATMIVTDESFLIYMDGLISNTLTNSLPPSGANLADITFGAGTDGIVPYWGGLDDIRMYADALTDCEVWALFTENDPNFNQFDSVEVCMGSSYTFGDGVVYDAVISDTSHFYSIPSSFGCDSIIKTIYLSPTLPYATIEMSPGLLTAMPFGESYQWIDCDDGFAPVSGATEQTFAAPAGGNYAVSIDFGDCNATSDCISTATIGREESSLSFEVYPNPSKELLLFHTELSRFDLFIHDPSGQQVLSLSDVRNDQAVNISHLSKGMYFLTATSGDFTERIAFFVSP